MGGYPIHPTVIERLTTIYEIERLLLVAFLMRFLTLFSITQTFVFKNDYYAENVLLC